MALANVLKNNTSFAPIKPQEEAQARIESIKLKDSDQGNTRVSLILQCRIMDGVNRGRMIWHTDSVDASAWKAYLQKASEADDDGIPEDQLSDYVKKGLTNYRINYGELEVLLDGLEGVMPVVSEDKQEVTVEPGPVFQYGFSTEPALMENHEVLAREEVREHLEGKIIRFRNLRPQDDNPTFANAYLDTKFGVVTSLQGTEEAATG